MRGYEKGGAGGVKYGGLLKFCSTNIYYLTQIDCSTNVYGHTGTYRVLNVIWCFRRICYFTI